MSLVKFTKMGLLTPVVAAAQAMTNFYYSVALRAAGEWASVPESDRLVIQEGQLQLSFRSTGDAVPWHFVKQIALILYEAATLGLTDLFDAIYVDQGGTVAVTVSMKIADALTSSDGSTQDYREGSVPSVSFP